MAGEDAEQRRDDLRSGVHAAQSTRNTDEGQGYVWAPVQAQQQWPLDVLTHDWQGQPDRQLRQRLHATQTPCAA